jgi:glycosyltransferase involved in cell wall biosynthesis
MEGSSLVSVVVPVHNGATTLDKTLSSLLRQKEVNYELIIVDDGSEDGSLKVVSKFFEKEKKIDGKIIHRKRGRGTADSYNTGIKIARGKLIVTMHQDVILKTGALKLLIEPFTNPNVVASEHIVDLPMTIWNKYNFWQKVYFSRLVGKKFCGLDGKFDCYRTSCLEAVSFFDSRTFHTAGEDGDIIRKLQKLGKIVSTKAEIVHIHESDLLFGPDKIIKKHAQYAQAQGALLRRYGLRGVKQLIRSFFREILFVMVLVGPTRMFGIMLVVIYCFLYTKRVYLTQYRDPRILLLPWLNIILIPLSTLCSIYGFVTGKQTITV